MSDQNNNTPSFQAEPNPDSFEAKPEGFTAMIERKRAALQAELESMPGNVVRSSPEKVKERATILVDQEIVDTRLQGRPELLARWKTQNAPGYRYLIGKKTQEIGGFAEGVQRVDRLLAQPQKMRSLPGTNQVVDATGRVMSRATARKIGLLGKDE